MIAHRFARKIAVDDDAQPPALSDADLMNALATGKEWAVDAFYDRFENKVDAVLVRMVGGTNIDLDELMLQTMQQLITAAVWERVPTGGDLSLWVALATQRLALDALRSRTVGNA